MTPILWFAASAALAMNFAACGTDDDDAVEETGGSGGSDTGGRDTGGSDNGGSATGGTANGGADTGGTANEGGEGGGPVVAACDLSRTGRTEEVLSGEISEDTELDASKVYLIEGFTYVTDGATLTIPPCSRLEGDDASSGTLIVSRGSRIDAVGTADEPILFTAAGEAEAGSWGGLVILGSAPVSLGDDVTIEGVSDVDDPRHHFGGTDDGDDSGTLSYVRIEYSGIALTEGSEINGLSLGGVGSGTTIDHVMVRDTLDDCFEFFGGTVNADHLICVRGGDDMFDTDDGYTGTLSYVLGIAGNQSSSDPQGLEWDGTEDTAGAFTTRVTLQNATLCGDDLNGFSMVLRRGVTGQIDELIAVGFPTGIDLRDDVSDVTITNSTIVAEDLAAVEEAGTEADNDGGVDDAAWFTDGTNNDTSDPDFTAEDCLAASGPASAVFSSDVGAFEGDPDWATGLWTGWE